MYSRYGLTGQYVPVFTGYLVGLCTVHDEAELRVLHTTTLRTIGRAGN